MHATLTAEDASEQRAARHGNDREQDNGVWDDGLPSAGVGDALQCQTPQTQSHSVTKGLLGIVPATVTLLFIL